MIRNIVHKQHPPPGMRPGHVPGPPGRPDRHPGGLHARRRGARCRGRARTGLDQGRPVPRPASWPRSPRSGWSSVILKTAGALTPSSGDPPARPGRRRHAPPAAHRRGRRPRPVPPPGASGRPAVRHPPLARRRGPEERRLHRRLQRGRPGSTTPTRSAATSTSSPGLGVTVAVLDSGMAPSRDLSLAQAPDKKRREDLAHPRQPVNFVSAPAGRQEDRRHRHRHRRRHPQRRRRQGQGRSPPGAAPSTATGRRTTSGRPVRARDAHRRHHRRQRSRLCQHRQVLPHVLRHRAGVEPGQRPRARPERAGTSVSTVIAGLQWAVANQYDNPNAYKIRVINLSLGPPGQRELHDRPAVSGRRGRLDRAGIVVVCAAGNDGRASAPPTTRALSGERGLGDELRLHPVARQRPLHHHRRGRPSAP